MLNSAPTMSFLALATTLVVFGRASGHENASIASLKQDSFLHNGVTAHRGNSAEFPENTMSAFESGIAVGADWIELDVFRTRDGKLVVIHDRTTGRTGNKDLDVRKSTYDALRTVDVATGFRKRTNSTLGDVPAHKIPLLADVLGLVMKQNRTRVSIQPKTDCVAEAVAVVKRMKAEPWVGFNDGNLNFMAEAKRLAPEIPVFWDRGANADIDRDVRIAKEHGFEAVVLHHSGITSRTVRKARAAGLEVGAWTVNDPGRMRKLLEMGVQRIYTDRPELLLALKSERRYDRVRCEGRYRHHLQGFCVNEDSIYWSFTTTLVKTDSDGTVVAKVSVANHHGDLCYHDGKLYMAVNLGKFNDPQGRADSWVYVYDADTLQEIARHEVQEAVYGAGGIGFHHGRFFVVGGLPPGSEQNYVYEYNRDFKFVKRHVVQSGYTLMGIQTATFAHGRWWFGCYGDPRVLLITDEGFDLQGRFDFDCSLGIERLPGRRLLSASGACASGEGCQGSVRVAMPDEQVGLRYVNPVPVDSPAH